jgi:glycosyltransferase involved in cell wall biosynthesis
MKLDVIVPTYNRSELLQRTLKSLLTAEIPPGLSVEVTVVDNNSKDETRRVVEEWMPEFSSRLHYLFEGRQGRSFALNAGIAATTGDLVGFIDDDEEIDRMWFTRAVSAFEQHEQPDFVGGPYAPRWGAPCPAWLPVGYRGVIGWVDGGRQVAAFDADFPGILMGGNAVLKREILEKVGTYSTTLGRTDKGLLSCEDEDFYRRLLAAGGRGIYLPDLIIYHFIPPERLTKKYFRSWCYWRGISRGMIDRGHPAPVVYLFGVPRYLFGTAIRGLIRWAKGILPGPSQPAEAFAGELAVWDLAGFFYGRHLYKPAQMAKPNSTEAEYLKSGKLQENRK